MKHTKKIALVLVALAASAWHFANPPAAKSQDFAAATCYYAGLAYSQGACLNGQRCLSDGTWGDDASCKSNVVPVEGAS
jgi:hypothetical protein